jgi:hypothetical protein
MKECPQEQQGQFALRNVKERYPNNGYDEYEYELVIA